MPDNTYNLDPFTRKMRAAKDQPQERTPDDLRHDKELIDSLYGFASQPESDGDEEEISHALDPTTTEVSNVYSMLGEATRGEIQKSDESRANTQQELTDITTTLHTTESVAGKFERQMDSAKTAIQTGYDRLGLDYTARDDRRIEERAIAEVVHAGVEDNLVNDTSGDMLLHTPEQQELTDAALAAEFLRDVRDQKVNIAELPQATQEEIYSYMGSSTPIEHQSNQTLAELGKLLKNLPPLPKNETATLAAGEFEPREGDEIVLPENDAHEGELSATTPIENSAEQPLNEHSVEQQPVQRQTSFDERLEERAELAAMYHQLTKKQ